MSIVLQDDGNKLPCCCRIMGDYENICLCALNGIFGYEPGIALALIRALGSASAVFGMSVAMKEELLGPYSKYRGRLSTEEIDKAGSVLEKVKSCGGHFVGITSQDYPSRLKQCPDAPVGLFFKSRDDPRALFEKAHYVAVVGTRNLSPYGEANCRELVRKLACAGNPPCVVSGLAYGADIVAQVSAVEAGVPTIGVMATGVDAVYPAPHRHFAAELTSLPGCGLVTDYPPGTAPVAVNFLRRNRIIAGLADAVILVESAVRGGGMNTCRLAFSYDREVYVLPGRLDDVHSQGCNRLLREGIAGVIDSFDDLNVRLGLGPDIRKTDRSLTQESVVRRYGQMLPSDKLETMSEIIRTVRSHKGADLDEIAAVLSLPYHLVAELASLLETDGFIRIDLLRRCTIV